MAAARSASVLGKGITAIPAVSRRSRRHRIVLRPVAGRLIHPPSCGSDGYVSLDLEVSKVTVGRKFLGLLSNTVAVNTDDVPHPRFIRIEYLRVDRRGIPTNATRTGKSATNSRYLDRLNGTRISPDFSNCIRWVR